MDNVGLQVFKIIALDTTEYHLVSGSFEIAIQNFLRMGTGKEIYSISRHGLVIIPNDAREIVSIEYHARKTGQVVINIDDLTPEAHNLLLSNQRERESITPLA